jgi:hypothetical protein
MTPARVIVCNERFERLASPIYSMIQGLGVWQGSVRRGVYGLISAR